MNVTREEVKRIAHLARLRFSEQELTRIAADLEQIFNYVEILDSLDLEGVPAMSHVHARTDTLRDDSVHSTLTREQALKNAPDTDGTYFRVPKVIE